MKRISLILVWSLLSLEPSHGQAQPSPAEAKLRDMVKTLTQRVTQAETDTAKVTAEKAASDAKLKESDVQIKKMTDALKEKSEELTKLREDSAKTEAALKTEVVASVKALKEHQDSLVKWRAAHTEISEIAKKKEADRSMQAAKASALERRVEDLRMRNAAMHSTANEILDRYKKFGLGDAIASREPFTGNMRIKLKNQVQEYADALLDATPESKRTPVPPKQAAKDEPQPAQKPKEQVAPETDPQTPAKQ